MKHLTHFNTHVKKVEGESEYTEQNPEYNYEWYRTQKKYQNNAVHSRLIYKIAMKLNYDALAKNNHIKLDLSDESIEKAEMDLALKNLKKKSK